MTAKARVRKRAIQKGGRGPGAKRRRPAQMRNLPVDDDEQMGFEAESARSGRTRLRPREGLVGAHGDRRQSRSAALERGQSAFGDEPIGAGSRVAPTRQAEARERERHRLQRQEGVIPAGEDGNLRQRRGPRATRASLDAAARAADQKRPPRRRAARR
jgi:hypothetical protein